jgi:hypothetical protein
MILQDRPRRRVACLIVLASLASAGCAAVPPAVLLTAGLAAGPAYQRGTMTDTLAVPQDRVYDAAIAAMEELGLYIQRVRFDESSAFVLATDDRGVEVTIRLTRFTESVTYMRIRIGFLGNRTYSQRVLERIREHAGVPGPFMSG